MSTFIINLNDTTVINDSVFAKVVKLPEVCQPIVTTEAETNCNDCSHYMWGYYLTFHHCGYRDYLMAL